MRDKKHEIEATLTDTIISRPVPFDCGGRCFYLYPPSYGKMLMMSRYIGILDIDAASAEKNIYLEALRIAKDKREECLEYIVIGTCKTKAECLDHSLKRERKDFFEKELDDEDIASLLILLLSADKTELIMTETGISKEQERMKRVMSYKSKNDKGSISFGGKSAYGSIIDAACERYGWTYDYAVWGISYSNLRLMLADKIVSMYLTDEERKKIPASLLNDSDIIRGDDPKNKELIRQMDWH